MYIEPGAEQLRWWRGLQLHENYMLLAGPALGGAELHVRHFLQPDRQSLQEAQKEIAVGRPSTVMSAGDVADWCWSVGGGGRPDIGEKRKVSMG